MPLLNKNKMINKNQNQMTLTRISKNRLFNNNKKNKFLNHLK